VPEATKKATSRTLNKQFIRPFHAISQLAKLLIKMAQSIFISFVASVRFFGPNFRCPQTNQQASEKLIKVFCQYNILIMRKLTKVSSNAPRGKRVFLFCRRLYKQQILANSCSFQFGRERHETSVAWTGFRFEFEFVFEFKFAIGRLIKLADRPFTAAAEWPSSSTGARTFSVWPGKCSRVATEHWGYRVQGVNGEK